MRRHRCAAVRDVAALAFAFIATVSAEACRKAHARTVEGGDADRGKVAIRDFGCGSCHTISGVAGAEGVVGPSLSNFSERRMIAGSVPNTTDFLIRWIEVPHAIKPVTDMPNLAVPENDARDIAAYLYAH